jgi:hypothetical protein
VVTEAVVVVVTEAVVVVVTEAIVVVVTEAVVVVVMGMVTEVGLEEDMEVHQMADGLVVGPFIGIMTPIQLSMKKYV